MHTHLGEHQVIHSTRAASSISCLERVKLDIDKLAVSPLNLLSIKAHLTLFSIMRIGFHLQAVSECIAMNLAMIYLSGVSVNDLFLGVTRAEEQSTTRCFSVAACATFSTPYTF